MSRFMASSETAHGTIIIIMFCSDQQRIKEGKMKIKSASTKVK